jgi:hypothetical protein
MPHEFFWVFGVQFEVLSQTYVPGAPICDTGYCPAIDSHSGISQYYFQDIHNKYSIVSRRIRKAFGGCKKLQKSNSASVCKFRPDGHDSTRDRKRSVRYVDRDMCQRHTCTWHEGSYSKQVLTTEKEPQGYTRPADNRLHRDHPTFLFPRSLTIPYTRVSRKHLSYYRSGGTNKTPVKNKFPTEVPCCSAEC